MTIPTLLPLLALALSPTQLPPTQEKVQTAPDTEPQLSQMAVYEVADLIGPASSAALEEVLEAGARQAQAGLQDEVWAALDGGLAQTERLAELIEEKYPGGPMVGGVDAPVPGMLLVEGDEAAHAFARSFLDAQRGRTEQLVVTMNLIEVPRGGLADLGIEGSSALFEKPGSHAAFLARLLAAEDVEVLSAPRIAVAPRQRASVSTTFQVAYVSDYELKIVEPSNQAIADPIIEVVQEGTTVDFDAVPMPGGVVELDLEVVYSQLERPIATGMKRIGLGDDAQELELGLPEVETVRLNSLLALRPGTAALFASAAPDADRDFAVLLHLDVPRLARDPVVDELFAAMHSQTYSHTWFPPLDWNAVPALVELGSSNHLLTRFPTNPFSSQSQGEASEGLVALWLVEGLCQEGNFGGLNPLLVERGKPLDATLESQLRLQAEAQVAYRRWWSLTRGMDRLDAMALDPLEDTGLAWYGSVRR